MGHKSDTARTLASMRRNGATLTHSDTHTADGRRVREPRPAARRTGTRGAIVRNAVREG
jgi:hypothetical protein